MVHINLSPAARWGFPNARALGRSLGWKPPIGAPSAQGHPAQAHRTFTVFGTVLVADPCDALAYDGYSDLTAGVQVTVSGSAGRTVAVGPLGAGNDDLGSSPGLDQCIFPSRCAACRRVCASTESR
jgi:hypothetical protein